MSKDNITLNLKISLRLKMLSQIPAPIIMETHGGWGKIFLRCYYGIQEGVVFEKKPDRAACLARQRPTWAVYEADCQKALAAGVGNHLEVNFLDVDPYGSSWPAIDAFWQSERPWPKILAICVQDGLRQMLQAGKAWQCKNLQRAVETHGNQWCWQNYLSLCQQFLIEKGAQRDYTLRSWEGYYCGHLKQMTHYAGIFTR